MTTAALLTLITGLSSLVLVSHGLMYPMGSHGCPFLPCPKIPDSCPDVEPTWYWHSASGSPKVLCRGCDSCNFDSQVVKRELDSHADCEAILCAPLPPSCLVSATREPAQLVASNGQPCAACPVCLDYVSELGSSNTGGPAVDDVQCPRLPCPLPPCAVPHPTYYTFHGKQCQGCSSCDVIQVGKRELDSHADCEAILCAPLPPSCLVSATREPAQLVASNGQPCAACPVCLDYVSELDKPLVGR